MRAISTYHSGHERRAVLLLDEIGVTPRRDAYFPLDIKIPCLACAGILYGLRCAVVWCGMVSRERRPHPSLAQHDLAEE